MTATPVCCGQACTAPVHRKQVGTAVKVNHSGRAEPLIGHTHCGQAIEAITACYGQANSEAPLILSKDIAIDGASICRTRAASALTHTTRGAAIVNTSHPEEFVAAPSTLMPVSARRNEFARANSCTPVRFGPFSSHGHSVPRFSLPTIIQSHRCRLP